MKLITITFQTLGSCGLLVFLATLVSPRLTGIVNGGREGNGMVLLFWGGLLAAMVAAALVALRLRKERKIVNGPVIWSGVLVAGYVVIVATTMIGLLL